MTLRPTKARQWFIETAAVLLLGLPVAFVAVPTQADLWSQNMVYPRAGVSSDAYRTPPQLLAQVSARPIVVQHRGQSQTLSRVQTATGRTRISDSNVVQIAHQVQPANQRTNRQSVRTELQRLYAEEGRNMPQMAIPSHSPQPSTTAHLSPVPDANAAPPVHTQHTQQPQRSTGLFAGLFDFGRSHTSRYSTGQPMQPPAEPAPFRPPTYRQQQQQQQQMRQQQMRQHQTVQTPGARTPNPQVTAQQPSARTAQSNAVIELKRVTPDRKFASQEGEFFPEDDANQPQIVPQKTSTAQVPQNSDDLAEFFPEESDTTSAVAAAANTAKEKMQQLFQDRSQANTDVFQMPVPTQEEVIPQPAPAAVSEVVTTNIIPMPADGLAEPAPFFADDERAIDPQERLEIAEVTGQTFDPSGADSESTAGLVTDAEKAGSRMQQIAAREGVGLKGYCPVALRDERRLSDGKAAYVSYYQGKAYYFSSAEAKDKFDVAPVEYAPASAGEDLTMKTLTGEVIDGSLDYSVWYKGRLYLFHSAENLQTFMAAPSAMAITQ